MPNSAPKCGICTYIEVLGDTPKRDEVLTTLNSSEKSTERIAEELAPFGLKTSGSSIRRHRRETPTADIPVAKATSPVPTPPVKAPPGWEPYTEHTESIGSAIVRLPRPNSAHRDLLIGSGLNPDEWQIKGPVNTRKWMRYDQEWLHYYKFDVVAGESPEVVEEHVDDLVALIRTRPRIAPELSVSTDDAFVFNASDWQIGKREGNDGTPQTIARVLTSIDQAVDRVRDLRNQGKIMPTLLFTGLGDLGEGTCGFYPGQQFLIDRNRREQGRINRELITTALDQLTPMFQKTIVAAVGGNHGENRGADGKRITSDGDNDDCAYFDAVKEAFDRSGRTDIEWRIMEDELSMMVNAGGVDVGLTHGHLFGNGATAQKKALEWWKGQDFGFQAVRGSRILISAHFHHFSSIDHGSRTHFQTPAMDPGSKWFRETSGQESAPGTLTFRLDGTTALGWDDLSILNPSKV